MAKNGSVIVQRFFIERRQYSASTYSEFVCFYIMRKGQKHKPESKIRISLAKKGKKLILEHRKKISDSRKRKGSPWLIGRKLSEQHKKDIGKENKGKHHWSLKMRMKMSNERMGSKNPNWNGGTSPRHKLDRMNIKYRLWREEVFKRDNYTCQICGTRGGYIEPDHIKPFALYPELRFDINNGRTLCKKCHEETPTYGYSKIYSQIKNVYKKQTVKCPDCGTRLKIITIGFKEEAECPGCGYSEVSKC